MDLLDKKDYKKYFLYAIIEIVLIVIGILIALQINNWNNSRLERKEELKTYEDIKQQVQNDKKQLIDMQAYNRIHMGQLTKANEIISSQRRQSVDTLAFLIMMMSQYSDFDSSGNIYENLVMSGDLKLLQNEDIPAQLKKLEYTYNLINRMEDIHWQMIINELSRAADGTMNYNSFELRKPDGILQPDKLYSPEIQNVVYEVKYLTIAKDTIYGRALREIDGLITTIDDELDNDLETN